DQADTREPHGVLPGRRVAVGQAADCLRRAARGIRHHRGICLSRSGLSVLDPYRDRNRLLAADDRAAARLVVSNAAAVAPCAGLTASSTPVGSAAASRIP